MNETVKTRREHHRKLKKDYKNLFLIVKAVIHRWDPYSLLAMGAPEDEFDSEIASVVSQLNRIHSAKDAAQVLSRVFTSSFGQGFKPESCLEIGELLYKAINFRKSSIDNR
jgi:hypothetical protein